MNIVYKMMAHLQLARDKGLIEQGPYFKLRREIWRFALAKTQDEEHLQRLLRKLSNVVEPQQ
jgi:hypothetical protein